MVSRVPEGNFDRKPYNVSYTKDGVRQTIRRVPPPKLHDLLPEDKVTIRRTKGDDWEEGDEVTVRGVGRRQPNTLQVEGQNGKKTFLPYFDVAFKDRAGEDVIVEDELKISRDPLGSKYLLWP
ncbi:MAG: hypothetical protein IOD12_09790 [Silvanigrellales bacterium]|nr:hypothetical protein [Silvanigrellales bacterium]